MKKNLYFRTAFGEEMKVARLALEPDQTLPLETQGRHAAEDAEYLSGVFLDKLGMKPTSFVEYWTAVLWMDLVRFVRGEHVEHLERHYTGTGEKSDTKEL